jgi:hypothetical protein
MAARRFSLPRTVEDDGACFIVKDRSGPAMTRPRLATLVCVTLLASLVSLGMPWISIYTLGRIRMFFMVIVSVIALIVVSVTALAAVAFHGPRGLWTILAAIPAFFWPVVAISIVTACSIYDCD